VKKALVTKVGRLVIAVLFAFTLLVLAAGSACRATPSSEEWTNCVIDVQAPGVAHLTYDTYSSRRGSFPTDLGLTYGLRLSKIVNAEVGFDWLSSTAYPVYFNAKVGVAEGALHKGAPGFSVGVFNVGTKKNVTNQDVYDIIIGKTVATNLRLHAGYYHGNSKLLVSSTGSKENDGFMFAFDYGFKPLKAGYNQFAFVGDYASGKNGLGGSSLGLTYNISPKADVIAGPVWFNDQGINGKVKWTTQLDINF
jgi:hypothetical protein